uniref:Protein S100 n=1 Tax=Amphiprion percula TaxID=161767 RepID=A0A3P8SIU6_AMPPE
MSFTRLDVCVGLLVETFNIYAKKDGNASTLTKAEAKELFKAELKGTLVKATEEEETDKIFNELDADKDGVINFQEFVTLVGSMATLCHDYLTELGELAKHELPAPRQ